MSGNMNGFDTSIVSYGVSEHLISEFDMLREAQCLNGNNKFPSKTVDLLAQHIVCRHYGNLCYEFSHLNWAIIFATSNSTSDNAIQTGLINYYWIDQCQWPQHFRKYFAGRCLSFEETQEQSIALYINDNEKSDGVTIRVYDHVFSISASRANILACFMEWLIGIIPNLLNLMEDYLHGKGHNAIRELSSFLQKQIYDYLSQHLPPAKLQQRFRFIQNWYNEADKKQLNDNNLLMFWQQHSTLEGYGKYSNVVKDSLSYLSALAVVKASANVQYANDDSYESLSELSSNDAEAHFDCLSQYHAQSDLPIRRLLDAPKALSKQQVEFFELYAQYPQSLLPFSATWLRLQVFGKVQHQIIQMVRVKDELAGSSQHYANLCQTDYREIKHNCVRLMASNQQSLLAISQLMLSFSPNQCCLILVKLMPQMPSFEAHTKTFASLIDEALSENKRISKKAILQWQLSYPWVNTLFKQSQQALKQINRQGFTSSTLLQSEDYLHCAELLFDLNKLIKQVLKQINLHEQDSQDNFDADRLIFINEFSRLYAKDEN